MRSLPPFYQDEEGEQRSLYWLNLNTNKRSITLAIETREGGRRWKTGRDSGCRGRDVRAYLDGLGLGYEALAKIKPDIILTSITGFGQTGPHAKYKAPDIVAWRWADHVAGGTHGPAERAALEAGLHLSFNPRAGGT
jgi:crotonobetainyl-CoA:carnitine CoA-transferase CaiB-like acyl-CoA transferase